MLGEVQGKLITKFGSFDLIIFDWDGTLFDSISPLIDLIRDAKLATPLTQQGEELKRSGLLPVVEQIIFAEQAVQVNDIKLLLNLGGFHQLDKVAVLYSGVRELLSTLHASCQKMAVVAGRPQQEILAEMQRTGVDHYFFSVMGSDQGPKKPSPAPLQATLTLAQCAPSRALMIGDSSLDMEMATLAEMSMLGVAYVTKDAEQYCVERLQPWQPLMIAHSVAELSLVLTGK